jgi:hypothetical protein
VAGRSQENPRNHAAADGQRIGDLWPAEAFVPWNMNKRRENRIVSETAEPPMPSATYDLFVESMIERKQILCTYGGYRRQLCAIILGHSQGQKKALTYQFGGESASSLPSRGDWKCLLLGKVSDVQLRDGPWHAGDSHTQRQRCVQEVDLDVNLASPYNPRRRLR